MANGYGAAARRMKAGERLYTAWSSIPSAELAGELARGGFPVVVLDMQHGGHDFSSVREGIQSVVAAGATAGVRVPVDAPHEISRALDQGAELIIVPMVNTVEDARRAAAFAKFPPVGERSWGPVGAMTLHGITDQPGYLKGANEATVLLAMIETRQALDNLEAILAVPGIDGVFVGPSDLSISLSDGAAFAPGAADTMATAKSIGERVVAAGKLAAIFCLTMDQMPVAKEGGFMLVALGVERAMIRQAAGERVAAANA